MRRHAPQLDDQLRAEGAHGGELEPHVGLVGKSGIACDVAVDLLAPASHVVRRDRPIEGGGHDLGHQLTDLRTRAVHDRPQPPHLIVEFDHVGELIGCELGISDSAPRNVAKKLGILCWRGNTAGAGCGSM